jgi:hypothetical protein
VDTQGLVIKAKVHPADLHDKEGGKLLLAPLAGQLPRMVKVWADSAYQGLQKWLKETLGWDLGGGKALVVGATLGMAARRSGAASAEDSCGVPSFASAVGGGTDFWVVRTESTIIQRL